MAVRKAFSDDDDVDLEAEAGDDDMATLKAGLRHLDKRVGDLGAVLLALDGITQTEAITELLQDRIHG